MRLWEATLDQFQVYALLRTFSLARQIWIAMFNTGSPFINYQLYKKNHGSSNKLIGATNVEQDTYLEC